MSKKSVTLCTVHTYLKVEDLLPYPNNPRTISRDRLDLMKRSIVEKGFYEPILVHKRDKTVLAGNHRLQAVKELMAEGYAFTNHLGETDVLPVVEEDVSDEVALGILLETNNHYAEWVDELLQRTLAEAKEAGLSMDAFGFTQAQLDGFIFKAIEESKTTVVGEHERTRTALTDEDDIPEVEVSRVATGQIWKLDDHRLMCGSCTDQLDVDRLFDGESVDITFTSPPYNIGRSPNGDEQKYRNDSDDKSAEDFREFLTSFTRLALGVSQFVFVNIQSLAGNKVSLIEYLYDNRDIFSDTIIWDKLTAEPAMGKNILNSQFEYVHIFSKRALRVIGTKEFRGTLSNVFQMNSRQDKEYAKTHKATFPVVFAEHFVRSFSNDSVYDPFCGSGSTLIACEKSMRKCYGMEIDPHYCSIILERWEKYTGKKAELIYPVVLKAKSKK